MRSPGTGTEAGDGAPWRWEWRVVSEASLAARVRAYEVPGVRQEWEETHLLTADSPHDVRLHGAWLERRRLVRTSSDGLQQWRPTESTEFPVEEAAAIEACDALRIAAPGVALSRVTRGMLLAHLRSPCHHVTELAVTKDRTPLRVLGCEGEHVTLVVNGRRFESIALESADQDEVRRAVVHLGFGTREDESYPAALKRIGGITIASSGPTSHGLT